MADLTSADTHFEFGKNWQSYASTIGDAEIEEATAGLRRILRVDSLEGKSFVDIGCGSGIHTLAALRMGAARVVAVDIDADSVATTKGVLARHAPGSDADVRLASVFDLNLSEHSGFDVVYSWGVLHHTGRMHDAMHRSAALVRSGGLFAFALYRKTWCCPLWTIEKRWYVHAGTSSRRMARNAYAALVRLGLVVNGRTFDEYLREYPARNRGMDFWHDVHDWLGGYPYESISPDVVDKLLRKWGFTSIARGVRNDLFARSGILGSGCDEYLYRKDIVTADLV